MKKEIWMVTILLLMATISAGVLGFVNIATRPMIKRNETRKLRESVLSSLNVNYEPENVEGVFKSEVETKEIGGREVYLRYGENEELSAVAFKIAGSGFQGQISAIISLKPDLETIVGLEVLSQEETPGLGARITEDEFLRQFNGKVIQPKLLIVNDPAGEENKVDAITGATRTSKSVESIINNDVTDLRVNVLTEEIMEELRNE